jgi:shikimate dehydrogenase
MDSVNHIHDICNRYTDLLGFNVTIPFKQDIIPYLNETDETAAKVGAVNAVKITRLANKKLHLKGYNTDVWGFKESFLENLQHHHKRALILGTGGASKAVAYVLNQLHINFSFVSRKPVYSNNQIHYDDLSANVFSQFQIVINSSPQGQFPNTLNFPDIPYHLINEKFYLYDLIYNPAETVFLRLGAKRSATCMNGYKMLILQAEKSFEIFSAE